MACTVAEFRDVVRSGEERPEWRAELCRLVLTEELLALPEQIPRLRRDGVRALVIGEPWATSEARDQARVRQGDWKVGADLSDGFLTFRRQ